MVVSTLSLAVVVVLLWVVVVVPVCVGVTVGEGSIAAATDTQVLVLIKGPAIVSKAGLVLDATYNTGPELAAVYAAIEALGIACNDGI